MSISAFQKVLNSDQVSGGIIRLAAIFEDRLGFMLAFYFAKPSTLMEFNELVIEKMSLSQKLELLKSIKMGSGTKSRDNLISSLTSLKKIRNHLAHSYYHVGEDQLSKLYSDKYIRDLALNYPKSLSDEKRNLESRTAKIWRAMTNDVQT